MNQNENDIDIDEHFMDWELGTNAEYKYEAANVNKVDEAKSHKSIIWKVMAVLAVVGVTFIGSIKLMSFGWSDAANRNLQRAGAALGALAGYEVGGNLSSAAEGAFIGDAFDVGGGPSNDAINNDLSCLCCCPCEFYKGFCHVFCGYWQNDSCSKKCCRERGDPTLCCWGIGACVASVPASIRIVLCCPVCCVSGWTGKCGGGIGVAECECKNCPTWKDDPSCCGLYCGQQSRQACRECKKGVKAPERVQPAYYASTGDLPHWTLDDDGRMDSEQMKLMMKRCHLPHYKQEKLVE